MTLEITRADFRAMTDATDAERRLRLRDPAVQLRAKFLEVDAMIAEASALAAGMRRDWALDQFDDCRAKADALFKAAQQLRSASLDASMLAERAGL